MKTILKYFYPLLVCLYLNQSSVNAQNIGINATGAIPNSSAMLDVDAGSLPVKKGMLIPRVTAAEKAAMNPLPSVAQGLLIYQTDAPEGFYYNTSTTSIPNWTYLHAGWSLTGNAGTSSGTHFLGTTDAQSLQFKVNNQKSGCIDPSGGNTSLGYQSFVSNTTGNNNSSFGSESMKNNLTGNCNVAIGSRSLFSNTAGSHLIAIGDSSLYNTLASDITGNGLGNLAIGNKAMYSNTTGIYNNAIGRSALYNGNTSSYNCAFGDMAMYNTTTGYTNVAIGNSALRNNTTGFENTAVGEWAGSNITTGNDNTFLGRHAEATAFSGSISNATAIGAFAQVSRSNSIVLGSINPAVNVGIGTTNPQYATLQAEGMVGNTVAYFCGNASPTNRRGVSIVADEPGIYFNCYWNSGTKAMASSGYPGMMNIDQLTGAMRFYTTSTAISSSNSALAFPERMRIAGNGNVGIGSTNPLYALEVNGSAGKPGGGSWTALSDFRLKKEIKPYTEGLQQIMQIDPVSYHYNEASGYDTKPAYVGVIAQELKKVAPYMVGSFQKDGIEYYNVDNSAMIYMLINAVKEQQNEIEKLKAESVK